MKYIPLTAMDRKYVGEHWNRQLLRGVQCILLATYGKVGPNLDFFEAAFGSNEKEFIAIALMPEEYIIYRRHHARNGAAEWRRLYDRLTRSQRGELVALLGQRRVATEDVGRASSRTMKRILTHYVETDRCRS